MPTAAVPADDGYVNPTTIVTIIPTLPSKLNTAPIGQLLGGLRLLPPSGRRGILETGLPLPYIKLNDQTTMLAPGAVIYDANNRTVLPGSLPAGKLEIVYGVDLNGQINRIYFPTPQERARLDPWYR